MRCALQNRNAVEVRQERQELRLARIYWFYHWWYQKFASCCRDRDMLLIFVVSQQCSPMKFGVQVLLANTSSVKSCCQYPRYDAVASFGLAQSCLVCETE